METLGDKKVANVEKTKFYCEDCDYLCYKKFNFEKHILTTKHQKVTKSSKKVAKSSKKEPDDKMITKYSCELCNKEYSSRNGL